MYLASVFFWVFPVLEFRKIRNIRPIKAPEGFDSHPWHHLIHFVLNQLTRSRSPRSRRVPLLRQVRADLGSMLPQDPPLIALGKRAPKGCNVFRSLSYFGAQAELKRAQSESASSKSTAKVSRKRWA